MRRSRWYLLLAIPLLLGVYGLARRVDGGEYRGHYTMGLERSSFVPCGSNEDWWVEIRSGRASDELTRRLPPRGRVPMVVDAYVVWRGKPSDRGHFGHVGRYDRTFEVRSVAVARPSAKNDCDR
jgi:hypothetical protein